MKSDVIRIDNQGLHFADAMKQSAKTAEFVGLDARQTLHLQIMTEELLSLIRSITGSMEAAFWIENDADYFELHLITETRMTQEKRAHLLQTASSGKNAAAATFLGKLRNFLEEATTPSERNQGNVIPEDVLNKLLTHQVLPQDTFRNTESSVDLSSWDGYEKSILNHVADNVRIAIRGDMVDITVVKDFGL